uniref:Uncharacterized protein n=1 Tax=Rhizophora mucronata TaxID=61149 RepID=A0A2P2QZF0_RHIMU
MVKSERALGHFCFSQLNFFHNKSWKENLFVNLFN